MTSPPRPYLNHSGFHTTRWTQVCRAKADSDDGRRALADLCDAYYEPVVTYLRCVVRDADAARDLSHAFFAEMLAGGTIDTADQARGKFRSYLLGAVKHFLSRQRETAGRLKRGGNLQMLPLDDDEACAVPDTQHPSPDAEFDRQWAITMLARALEALRQECVTERRALFFDIVKPLLTGDAAHGDQSAMATACDMNVVAFRMAVHRLKKRLRQCVKTEVAGTLDDAASVQDEMQTLFTALGG